MWEEVTGSFRDSQRLIKPPTKPPACRLFLAKAFAPAIVDAALGVGGCGGRDPTSLTIAKDPKLNPLAAFDKPDKFDGDNNSAGFDPAGDGTALVGLLTVAVFVGWRLDGFKLRVEAILETEVAFAVVVVVVGREPVGFVVDALVVESFELVEV